MKQNIVLHHFFDQEANVKDGKKYPNRPWEPCPDILIEVYFLAGASSVPWSVGLSILNPGCDVTSRRP